MKRISFRFAAPMAIVLCLTMVSAVGYAQVPDPNDILEMAIYFADTSSTDDLPDSLVNYDITDSGLIASMFGGIEADTLRDCSDLEADTDAFVYVRFNDLTRKVYHLILEWSHFHEKGDEGNCHWVNPVSRSLFEANAQ